MKESYWALLFVILGLIGLSLLITVQSVAGNNDHDYYLLKEATEGAMIDAVDLFTYRKTGLVAINEEKFVESLIRRFAEGVTTNKDYNLEIVEVNEAPPKVSVRIVSNTGYSITFSGDAEEMEIANKIDAILELED